MRLSVNPGAQPTWHEIGEARTAVLVVDDFLADAGQVRAFAQELAYFAPSHKERYPGVRSPISLAGGAALKQWMAEHMLGRLFTEQRAPHLTTAEYDPLGAFCLFTGDAGSEVRVEDQHVDGAYWLAAVLHLSTSHEGRGTAFWRHRATGLQHWVALDALQLGALESAFGLCIRAPLAQAKRHFWSNEEVARLLFAAPATRRPFTADSDDCWERLALIPSRFNRLVLYPTWQIHSLVDTSSAPLTRDEARLTFNQMIDYPLPRAARRDRTAYPASFYRAVVGLLP